MLTLKEKNNEIIIKSSYSYAKRIRNMPGAHFNYDTKCWVTPLSSLPYIQKEFKGEIYYQTPQWKLEGKPEPPKQNIKFFKNPVEIPTLNLKPYDYQKLGIQFCVKKKKKLGFCMVGDQVGLGKTLVAAGTMKWYKQHRHINRILIICKKSIKHQWASELNKYTGWEKIYVTGEPPKKRKQAYDAVKSGGVLITNYHNYLNDTDLIKEVNFDLCIVDEAHCIKGRSTKMNKNIGSVIRGKKTILMTGTPVMSKPDDIYGIVKMASPKFFGSYKEFEDNFLVVEYGIYGRQIVGAKNLDILQDKINSFLIRRTSDDVKLELPEILPPIKVITERDNVQKKLMMYIESEKEALDAQKNGLDDSEESRMIIDMLNEKSKMFIAASQFAADDPRLMKMGKKSKLKNIMGAMVPDNYKMSNKTEATIDLVQEILAADEKVIIFCLYATSAFMLKELIEENLGEKVVMYTGRENDEQRKQSYNSFLDDVNVLIGTEACAEGLNLQVAGYLINYEQSETYAQRNQRIGRIRRIGSKYDELKVYDMITKDSFDEIRYNKIMRDKDVSEALLNG